MALPKPIGNLRCQHPVKHETLKNKHGFYIVHIRLRNQSLVAESPLLLCLLLGEDVIFKSALTLDFTSASHFKALFGS